MVSCLLHSSAAGTIISSRSCLSTWRRAVLCPHDLPIRRGRRQAPSIERGDAWGGSAFLLQSAWRCPHLRRHFTELTHPSSRRHDNNWSHCSGGASARILGGAFALAFALRRKLVLPRLVCGYDKAWFQLDRQGQFAGAPAWELPYETARWIMCSSQQCSNRAKREVLLSIQPACRRPFSHRKRRQASTRAEQRVSSRGLRRTMPT